MGWTLLLDEITTVLFYERLQDPTVPSRKPRSNRDCPSRDWSSIPAGFNILTASLPCLRNACGQFNSDSGIRPKVGREEILQTGDPPDRRGRGLQ